MEIEGGVLMEKDDDYVDEWVQFAIEEGIWGT